jgi:hypothetical protein
MVSRYPGAYASPLHRRGGNSTRTGVKLSQAVPVQPIPGCCYSRFWLTNRTHLARQSQAAWLQLIAGPNLLLRESVERKAEQLRAELAGPEPSPLEGVLV